MECLCVVLFSNNTHLKKKTMGDQFVPTPMDKDQEAEAKSVWDEIDALANNLPEPLVKASCLFEAAMAYQEIYAAKKAHLARRYGQLGKSKSPEKLTELRALDTKLRAMSHKYHAAVEKYVFATRQMSHYHDTLMADLKQKLLPADAAAAAAAPTEKVDGRRRPRQTSEEGKETNDKNNNIRTPPQITSHQAQPLFASNSLDELE